MAQTPAPKWRHRNVPFRTLYDLCIYLSLEKSLCHDENCEPKIFRTNFTHSDMKYERSRFVVANEDN
uniref:Uncharacterized protein n=1 Tax=Romanomermis culicivorax TaxID=13658 RepID=A0A915IV01_ROMCU